MKTIRTAAFVLGLLLGASATAQADDYGYSQGANDYTFHGYSRCSKGDYGCHQWPLPPYDWIYWTDVSHLPAIACKQLMAISHVIAGGIGSCDPPLTLP